MVNFFKKFKMAKSGMLLLLITTILNSNATAAVMTTPILNVVNTPTENISVLNNPLMGWAPSAKWILKTQPYKLVYAEMTWDELESTKGVYNFSAVESKLNFSYWHQNDIKIILRLVLDSPTAIKHKNIPDWLYTEIKGDGTWYDNSYGKGFSPNYSNSTLIDYHQKLIAALGQRYNNSGDIAYIELGSIGHWGEWHTMQATGSTFIPFPSETIANKYVTHYTQNFSNKILLMRRPFNIATSNNMGLFNDIIGNSTETLGSYLSWINNGYYNHYVKAQQPAMPDFWKRAPSGGEFTSGNAGLGSLTNDKMSSTLNQLIKTHVSWIGPNCPANQAPNGALQSNFDTILNTIGYRFVLNKVTYPSSTIANKKIPVTITVTNKGVAPFYYKWPLYLYLIDSNGNVAYKDLSNQDIRSWLPGTKTFDTSLSIPSTTKPGVYKVALSIDDPSTRKPSVDFANKGKQPAGYFYVGNLTITK